jgi:hypothetical protein
MRSAVAMRSWTLFAWSAVRRTISSWRDSVFSEALI